MCVIHAIFVKDVCDTRDICVKLQQACRGRARRVGLRFTPLTSHLIDGDGDGEK